MSLVVGLNARTQLTSVENNLHRLERDVQVHARQGVWTREQMRDLLDTIQAVMLLKTAIESIIFDNQPTEQQRRS
jgi:hypothetical protein